MESCFDLLKVYEHSVVVAGIDGINDVLKSSSQPLCCYVSGRVLPNSERDNTIVAKPHGHGAVDR